MRHILLVMAGLLVQASCWGSEGGSEQTSILPETDPGPNETCNAWRPTPLADSLRLDPIASVGWERSVFALQNARFPGRWYMAEQRGVVSLLDVESGTREVVYDGRTLILSHEDPGGYYKEEQGLLSIAFEPDDTRNRLYLAYTVGPNPGALVVGYLTLSDDGKSVLEERPTEVIRIDQPYSNHNGAHLEFGPDGYLYIGVGDGGSAGDPQNHGQRVDTLLGSILRIDVGDDPYLVPEDNPLVGHEGRDEIFAWGLRNPWRFHFDVETGLLWAGDVGQNAYEEIDIIHKGGNYGWKILEGDSCYATPNCDDAELIPPVLTYPHSDGKSVTGGMVYRGRQQPTLYGTYLFGDFQSGRIWGIDADHGGFQDAEKRLLLDSGLSIASFAVDLTGEVYVLDLFRGLYRISTDLAQDDEVLVAVPERLSQTGCTSPEAPAEPSPGMLPYVPAQQFWADGADKRRFVAIPMATKIRLLTSGELDFPVGTVVRKDFTLNDSLVETRFFLRSEDGRWRGYSYRWTDEGDDAIYHQGGYSEQRFGTTWFYPSEAQCLSCHTEVAGRTLGLEAAQLKASGWLSRWEEWGYLEGDDWSGETFVDTSDSATEITDEAYARQYLHTNCSMCHQPGGGGGGLNLRSDTFEFGCDVAPTHGSLEIEEARIVVPGAPQRSVLLERMISDAANLRMAPGGLRSDEAAVARLSQWIEGLEACPQ